MSVECLSECLTLVEPESVQAPPNVPTLPKASGINPLWFLTGVPLVGGGVAILSGGGQDNTPSSNPPAVPLTDIALLPATVLSILVMIVFRGRYGNRNH